MKKIYQSPEMKIVKIQASHMIAQSPGYGDITTEDRGNLSRRRGFSWNNDAGVGGDDDSSEDNAW